MMPKLSTDIIIITLIAAACAGIFWLAKDSGDDLTPSYMDYKLRREKEAFSKLGFNLVDPNQAPDEIKDLVIAGFNAVILTSTYAQDYVGGNLNCTSCHFSGGNTIGGPQAGISLAGSATQFPAYHPRTKKVITLQDRINECFTKSMNGKPLPLDSELMLAIVTYLHWISKDLPMYGNIPWLRLPPLKTTHLPNPHEGRRVYEKYCAICHRTDGSGGDHAPALWGMDSFNDAAGMNKISIFASFVYWNMPYNDNTPVLSEEEALDVASYVLSKPRPFRQLE